MFPLLDQNEPNPVELFQIWLNLPGEDKLVKPHFAMLWSNEVPKHVFKDAAGRVTEVTTVAGELAGTSPPPPPPKSWAARPDTDVAIWCLKLEAGASWTLPAARHPQAIRTLYFFVGATVKIDDRVLDPHSAAVVQSDVEITIEAGNTACELLMLQGRPIGEPVAQHGPFVMNSREELQQAFADYKRTEFGGWPWPVDDPVHDRNAGRFAKHIDGHIEKAE
jgi:redox-sensitive bicupin YhaK (pirin superfamily)